jgi:hypothetical protein
MTTGVTGVLPVANGGTNLSSTTANQILYSSATNVIAGLATANNGLLVTSAAGVPSIGNAILADITVSGLTVGKGFGGNISTTVIGIGGVSSASYTGSLNTVGGYQAGLSLTSAIRTTAFGANSLDAVATASNNSGFGAQSLGGVSVGGQNNGFGANAGGDITNGSNNQVMGVDAGSGASSGAVALTTGNDNVIIGHEAGVSALDASDCISIGSGSVANKASGATSGDDGAGVAFGSAAHPVGFRGDDSIYPSAGTSAGYVRVKWNGTHYKMLLMADA